jgi:lysophospholipase L1-like esterase
VRILVLGDSSSAAIGSAREIYPYRLFCRLEKSGSVEVQNHSTPGFTSADAARYFSVKLAREQWDAVIVYLGNNEGGPGAHKGRYRPLADSASLGRRRSSPTLPAPPAPPRDYHLTEDDPVLAEGSPTTPAEFGQNLTHITNLAKARGAQVVLVSPFANLAYPASAGPQLSPFFKIVGSPSPIADAVKPIGEAATLIRDGMIAQEEVQYEAAARNYNAVLSSGPWPPWLLELASNNLAVLLHQAGRSSDAEEMFTSRASAGGAFSSIASYNLARLLRDKGLHAKADEWFGMALEQDAYLYRVKQAWRDAIAETATATGAHLLDLATILGADMFVDYCHPTAEAHDDIASALSAMLGHAPVSHSESSGSRYVSHHPSPDAFRYCDDDLVDYYDIAPPVDRKYLEEETDRVGVMLRESREQNPSLALRRISVDSPIQRSIVGALAHVALHPMITCADDLCRWPIQDGCELGRLPEHYIYRLMLGYLDWAYAYGVGCGLGDDDLEGRSDLRLYYRRLMIGRAGDDGETRINVDESYRRRLRRHVLSACQRDDLFRDFRAERLITVLRWYTREAFRYGTQSRTSMLYALPVFDSIVEALRVWIVLARFHGAKEDERLILAVYGWLRGLERIHRHYARLFVRQKYSTSEQDSAAFGRELSKWRACFPASAERSLSSYEWSSST